MSKSPKTPKIIPIGSTVKRKGSLATGTVVSYAKPAADGSWVYNVSYPDAYGTLLSPMAFFHSQLRVVRYPKTLKEGCRVRVEDDELEVHTGYVSDPHPQIKGLWIVHLDSGLTREYYDTSLVIIPARAKKAPKTMLQRLAYLEKRVEELEWIINVGNKKVR